jgi:hypothetical protein
MGDLMDAILVTGANAMNVLIMFAIWSWDESNANIISVPSEWPI